jgi:hypothetical protein
MILFYNLLGLILRVVRIAAHLRAASAERRYAAMAREVEEARAGLTFKGGLGSQISSSDLARRQYRFAIASEKCDGWESEYRERQKWLERISWILCGHKVRGGKGSGYAAGKIDAALALVAASMCGISFDQVRDCAGTVASRVEAYLFTPRRDYEPPPPFPQPRDAFLRAVEGLPDGAEPKSPRLETK